MMRQRLLKLVEDAESNKLDAQVHDLVGTDVTEYFKSDYHEEIVSIQSVSVVAYKDCLHAYTLVTTQDVLSVQATPSTRILLHKGD